MDRGNNISANPGGWSSFTELYMFSFVYFVSVWNETAIPFKEVIQQFEDWLTKHKVWSNKSGGCLNKAAFVTW